TSYGATPLIWYSCARVPPLVRGIATQLKPPWSDPVIAICTVFHRFALGTFGLAMLQPGQLGALPTPLSVQLHALVPPPCTGSFSGRLPSIMYSIDPELSMRSITFGSGGFVSTCPVCARADP